MVLLLQPKKYKMKKINIIYKVCCIASLLFVFSCNESEDIITGDAKEGGVIVRQDYSSAKITGLPDAETGEVSFREVEVEYDLRIRSGEPDEVTSYTVYKTLVMYEENPETGEIVVASEKRVEVETVNKLPYEVTYASIDEILEGFEKTPDQLRIGDQVIFDVEFVHQDGRRLTAAPKDGTLTITINCLSDLAGTYMAKASAPDAGINLEYEVEVVELAPGQYYFSPSSAYVVNLGYTGASAVATRFEDLCGVLTVPDQTLGGEVEGSPQFSNEVSGEGSVDSETGVITLEYSISGLGSMIDVLTPIE